MGYKEMETALQTNIQTIVGFADSQRNVVLYDYNALSRGISKGVVLRFGGMDHVLQALGGEHLHRWYCNCVLVVKAQNEATAQEQLRDNMQLILNRIDQYPKLNGTADVFYAYVSSIDEEPIEASLGNVKFVGRNIRIAIEEEIDVAEME